MDLSSLFHSGIAARRDGVCDRLKFKYKVKRIIHAAAGWRAALVRHYVVLPKD